MLRFYLEQELTELRNDLLSIWTSVLGQFNILLHSPTDEQCQELVENDALINEAVMMLDEKCQAVICLQHPVTEDLRRIVTIMKLNTEIERIGDRLVDIAKVIHLHQVTPEWQEVIDNCQVLQMAVRDQLKKSLEAYKTIQLETECIGNPRKEEVRAYYQEIEQAIISGLTSDISNVELGRNLLDMIQYLDKISNHISSVYKWIDYQKTGKIV